MSHNTTKSTNWGDITVLATGLDSTGKIRSAIIDLADERFQIEVKGSPRSTNGTTGYVLTRDGELQRWEYVGRMQPADDGKVQILTIGPDGTPLDDEMEELYYEGDDAVPRDEDGRPTSELRSVHEIIDDVEEFMAEAIAIAIAAWEKWESWE